jgi:hypothetical protein
LRVRLGHQRKHPDNAFNIRRVRAERLGLSGAECRAAVLTTVPLNLGFAGGSEFLDLLVLAIRAGHDRPLALKGDRADNFD